MASEFSQETRVGKVLAGWNSLGELGPIQIKRAAGARVQLENGKWYDDYIMGWGSCLLGHDSEVIARSIRKSLRSGYLQQYETASHEALGNKFCSVVPCAEKLRLVNSGLEGTMYALRIARAVTGKRLVVKFEGHFHGLNDVLSWNTDTSDSCGEFFQDGSLKRMAGTVGLPPESSQWTIPVSWNDEKAVAQVFEIYGADIAAVILEPIALNIGCLKPAPGFLEKIRELTKRHGALLIFDEVLTGFRDNLGGAQKKLNVTPDLAVYGKAFGCGVPIAGVAGKSEFMDVIAPRGPLQISGTNTGRYFSVCAALAVIEHLEGSNVFEEVAKVEARLKRNLELIFRDHSIPCQIDSYGGRIGVHIGSDKTPATMADVARVYPVDFANNLFSVLTKKYDLYGFLMPLAYCPEPLTLSACHTLEMIDSASDRLNEALREVPYDH